MTILSTVELNTVDRTVLVKKGLIPVFEGVLWCDHFNANLKNYGKRTQRVLKQSGYAILESYRKGRSFSLVPFNRKRIKNAMATLLEDTSHYSQRRLLSSPSVWACFFGMAHWLHLELAKMHPTFAEGINFHALEQAERGCQQACLDHPQQLIADLDVLEDFNQQLTEEIDWLRPYETSETTLWQAALKRYLFQLRLVQRDLKDERERVETGLVKIQQSVLRQDRASPVQQIQSLLDQVGIDVAISRIKPLLSQDDMNFLGQYRAIYDRVFQPLSSDSDVRHFVDISYRLEKKALLNPIEHEIRWGKVGMVLHGARVQVAQLNTAHQKLRHLDELYSQQVCDIAMVYSECERYCRQFQSPLIPHKAALLALKNQWAYRLFPWAFKKTRASIRRHESNVLLCEHQVKQIRSQIQQAYQLSAMRCDQKADQAPGQSDQALKHLVAKRKQRNADLLACLSEAKTLRQHHNPQQPIPISFNPSHDTAQQQIGKMKKRHQKLQGLLNTLRDMTPQKDNAPTRKTHNSLR